MMPRRMRIMDFRMDGRNPYGSAGGYVTSGRRSDRRMNGRQMYDRRMNDRARGRESYGYDDMDYYDSNREYSNRYNDSENERLNTQRMDGNYEQYGQYDRGSRYPFMVSGEFGRYDTHHSPYYMEDYNYENDYDYARSRNGRYIQDRNYDYAMEGGRLSERELKERQKDLMEEIEDKDKPMVKMDLVLKKAKDMGIEFEKFTEDEFYTTFLMVFTDYSKTLGTASLDTFVRLSKDWLCDKDSMLKYGEKLAAYFDYVVDGM